MQGCFQQVRNFLVGVPGVHAGEHGEGTTVVPGHEQIACGVDKFGGADVADGSESGCVSGVVQGFGGFMMD